MPPKNIPIFVHLKFSGVSKFDFIKPKMKKIVAIISDQTLIWPAYVKGHMLIMKKNIKKTKPKLRFDPIFIFDLYVTLLL